ncbi:MAG: hypothetical protein Q9200_007500 [Gallowayella weberi]
MGASLIVFACRRTGEVCAYKPSIPRVPALVASNDASPDTVVPRVGMPHIDYLPLSAGKILENYKKGPSGHEHTIQVNYLSNVSLIAKLLPRLEKSAESTGSAGRITWIGSRAHDQCELYIKMDLSELYLKTDQSESCFKADPSESCFRANPPIEPRETERYDDTKLLCAMFMYELAPLLGANMCVINMLCPSRENPNIGGDPSSYFRYSDDPEDIPGLTSNALLFASLESHGQISKDREIMSQMPAYAEIDGPV